MQKKNNYNKSEIEMIFPIGFLLYREIFFCFIYFSFLLHIQERNKKRLNDLKKKNC
jgi:hypothetical protein